MEAAFSALLEGVEASLDKAAHAGTHGNACEAGGERVRSAQDFQAELAATLVAGYASAFALMPATGEAAPAPPFSGESRGGEVADHVRSDSRISCASPPSAPVRRPAIEARCEGAASPAEDRGACGDRVDDEGTKRGPARPRSAVDAQPSQPIGRGTERDYAAAIPPRASHAPLRVAEAGFDPPEWTEAEPRPRGQTEEVPDARVVAEATDAPEGRIAMRVVAEVPSTTEPVPDVRLTTEGKHEVRASSSETLPDVPQRSAAATDVRWPGGVVLNLRPTAERGASAQGTARTTAWSEPEGRPEAQRPPEGRPSPQPRAERGPEAWPSSDARPEARSEPEARPLALTKPDARPEGRSQAAAREEGRSAAEGRPEARPATEEPPDVRLRAEERPEVPPGIDGLTEVPSRTREVRSRTGDVHDARESGSPRLQSAAAPKHEPAPRWVRPVEVHIPARALEPAALGGDAPEDGLAGAARHTEARPHEARTVPDVPGEKGASILERVPEANQTEMARPRLREEPKTPAGANDSLGASKTRSASESRSRNESASAGRSAGASENAGVCENASANESKRASADRDVPKAPPDDRNPGRPSAAVPAAARDDRGTAARDASDPRFAEPGQSDPLLRHPFEGAQVTVEEPCRTAGHRSEAGRSQGAPAAHREETAPSPLANEATPAQARSVRHHGDAHGEPRAEAHASGSLQGDPTRPREPAPRSGRTLAATAESASTRRDMVAGIGRADDAPRAAWSGREEQPQPGMPSASTRAVVDQIVRKAALHLGRAEGQMVIDLRPASLGRVHLRVTAESGKVCAEIRAESATARSLIEAGLPELKTALADKGLVLESVGLGSDIGSTATGNDGAFAFRQPWGQPATGHSAWAGPDASSARSAGPSMPAWFLEARTHVVDLMA